MSPLSLLYFNIINFNALNHSYFVGLSKNLVFCDNYVIILSNLIPVSANTPSRTVVVGPQTPSISRALATAAASAIQAPTPKYVFVTQKPAGANQQQQQVVQQIQQQQPTQQIVMQQQPSQQIILQQQPNINQHPQVIGQQQGIFSNIAGQQTIVRQQHQQQVRNSQTFF